MSAISPRVALSAALLCCAAVAAAAPAQVLDPGYGPLQYNPPAAGSYQLPPLGVAVDGKVLNDLGEQLTLYDLFDDKLVLLGFIYTHCSDINGCPLASFVMKKVQGRLAEDAGLAQQVRLISLSFDPLQDTPAILVDYARHFRRPGSDWQFLTTASETELQPILDGYGQWRQREYDSNGNFTGSMSHILRVFLIDRQHRIRNIYSSGFLDADTVVNDLRTLDMESRTPAGP
jgi:cytochrome c peroxidase